ncbi:hypothetical protein F441_17163 [Phytophthora nicotianae CJ01A1]|uniref:Myb-like domain-containing protein n=2 Tax=Phytophthora nicotianae TaxID=4792 RepID=W2G1M0_PHYNI|nr:hypothetical protein L915_16817 [Phytophthora nicotianae]ETL30282.1 hypothetical protein L916_16727 [Phytophthora nicotianae]ETP06455.1 hypothetical protein F441_17163 [Phytophthora nicotianae CJ01A1]
MDNEDTRVLTEVVETAEAPGNSENQAKRKKAFRFASSSDVLLLKKTVKHRPWAAVHGETQVSWASVVTGLKTALPSCTADGKACRRRFNALLDGFRRNELESVGSKNRLIL